MTFHLLRLSRVSFVFSSGSAGFPSSFPQAQQQGPLANISVAEAATAAANARHWMQRQNAGRTLGDKKKYVCVCALAAFTFKIFQALGAAVTSASKPAEKTGRRMATTATSGEPTRRTGPKLRTSARGRAAIWPLTPRTPPKPLSWRG